MLSLNEDWEDSDPQRSGDQKTKGKKGHAMAVTYSSKQLSIGILLQISSLNRKAQDTTAPPNIG